MWPGNQNLFNRNTSTCLVVESTELSVEQIALMGLPWMGIPGQAVQNSARDGGYYSFILQFVDKRLKDHERENRRKTRG